MANDCRTCGHALGADRFGVYQCTVYEVGRYCGYDHRRFRENGDHTGLAPHWRVIYSVHSNCPFHTMQGCGTIETGPPPLKEETGHDSA